MDIERLTESGIKLGYEGEDLKKFVSEQQQEEKKEKAIAREEKRRQDELELRERELEMLVYSCETLIVGHLHFGVQRVT